MPTHRRSIPSQPIVNRRPPARQRFVAGPAKATRATTDPMDGSPDLWIGAQNVYVPDPTGPSGTYSRPGFTLLNPSSPLATGTFRGQGAFSHTDLSSTTYNFVIANGRLFRVDSTFTTITDVTPVGITIDNAVATRVYGTSFANSVVITDGVNKPWVATNLSSTPITGTAIDFDGNGTAWTAWGPAVVYGGALFFILNTLSSVSVRTDIAWSAPGDPTTGYQQNPFDNRWTLEQTNTNPLYALAATNTTLYYFRERSIGGASGVVGPNFATTATQDLISQNVGTQMPQSIVQFGQTIFFTDAIGRPYALSSNPSPLLNVPGLLQPIWLQMRALVDAATAGFPGVTKFTTTAAFEPNLNLYLVAVWSPIPSQLGPATAMYAFDAKTLAFLSTWTIGTGYQIESLGNFVDANGRGVLVVLGSKAAPTGTSLAASGYVWTLNALAAAGDYLTTENGTFLTTEDGSTMLTSEGTGANWTDNGVVPTITATTQRLGYGIDTVVNAMQASALVGSTAPVTVSAQTSALVQTVEATPTPNASQDGVYRATVGFDRVQGRGVEVTVGPTTAASQWFLQQVSLDGTLSDAGVFE